METIATLRSKGARIESYRLVSDAHGLAVNEGRFSSYETARAEALEGSGFHGQVGLLVVIDGLEYNLPDFKVRENPPEVRGDSLYH